jgi:hypothetical protein
LAYPLYPLFEKVEQNPPLSTFEKVEQNPLLGKVEQKA